MDGPTLGTHFGKPAIVSSAAVTDAGEVYVVSSGAGEPGTTDSPYYVSALIHLGPDGAFKCVKGNVGEGLAYRASTRKLDDTCLPPRRQRSLKSAARHSSFSRSLRWVMVLRRPVSRGHALRAALHRRSAHRSRPDQSVALSHDSTTWPEVEMAGDDNHGTLRAPGFVHFWTSVRVRADPGHSSPNTPHALIPTTTIGNVNSS